MANEYSAAWHATFGASVDPQQTERETDFLARVLPLPAFRRVLDVACGEGRHLRTLRARGYEAVGVERDPGVAPEGTRILDMRELGRLDESFDAVISMWQSFGYFDDETNLDVLRQMADRLRPGGRLVLDVYHRGFFEGKDGERLIERGGRSVTERSELRGTRRRVRLSTGDEFDWRLYTPDELASAGEQVGLSLLLACTSFEESRPPTADEPRMQLIFETG
jgi:SAM-dependent methyltransferase